MIPGTHGSTFGGNPLAMRSANAVLDLLLETNFLDDLKEMINYFDKKMDEIIKEDSQSSPILVHKKGSGMLRGFQLDEKVIAGNFGNVARDKGLLLVGAAENTIRLLPPLNTSKEEVDKAFEILKNVIIEMKKN